MKAAFRLGYVPALDGLRGVAVMLVLLYHAGVPFSGGGFIGVDIFFVLSGFLITSLLLKEFDERGSINFKNFYVRRILRLVPALLVLLVIFDVLSLLLLPPAEAQINFGASVVSALYLTNWVAAFDLRSMSYLLHTWSLAIEEQFYLTWPLLLLILLRLHLSKILLMAVVLALAAASWLWRMYLVMSGSGFERVYYALDTRLDGLLLGCALAILMTSLDFTKVSAYLAGTSGRLLRDTAFTLIPLLLVVFMFAKVDADVVADWVVPLVNVFACVMVFYLVAVRESWLSRIFSIGALVFVGRISYGLYLWHQLVYKSLRDYLHMSWIGIFIFGTLIAFAIAVASYYLVEQPALKLKSRFRSVSGGRDSSKAVYSPASVRKES